MSKIQAVLGRSGRAELSAFVRQQILEPRITPFPLGGGLVSYVDTHGQPPNNGGQAALAFEVRGIEDAARARGSPNAGKPFGAHGLAHGKTVSRTGAKRGRFAY